MELLNQQKFQQTTDKLTAVEQLARRARLAASCCELCQGSALIHPLLCKYCNADLPRFHLADCQFDLLNWPTIDKLFPKRHFDQLLTLIPYLWPIDSLLKQLKYHNRFELADLFGFLLYQLWSKLPDDHCGTTLLSVPIHISKWQSRGYNQAHLIAKSLAKYSLLNYQPEVLTRSKAAPSQVGQSGRQRRKNINQAFNLNNHKQSLPSRVILLDDVITTGTTVNAISKLLKRAGVKQITVLTLALSLPL